MRLIDADALDDIVQDLNENKNYGITRSEYKRIDAVLFEFPTIEPERKTGRWVVTPDGRLACSNCLENPTNRIIINGNLVYDMTPIRKRMRYCPNCGARMEVTE